MGAAATPAAATPAAATAATLSLSDLDDPERHEQRQDGGAYPRFLARQGG
jgi:hypothetical protein